MHSCRPAHLLEALYGHDGCKRLALALDNKLIVAKRHPIQDIAEALANFQGRNFRYHVPYQLLQ
jgi:hypothetical protein